MSFCREPRNTSTPILKASAKPRAVCWWCPGRGHMCAGGRGGPCGQTQCRGESEVRNESKLEWVSCTSDPEPELVRMANRDQSQSATERRVFEVASSETWWPHQCFWEGTGLCQQQRGADLPPPYPQASPCILVWGRGDALALLSPELSVVNMTLTAILTVSIY